eukprot:TRINITY_DN1522_c0_g1_i12.p1 TRINITY_DN1522_c0_g1~~TRINITY_DN1522_c0_g1_i12.p1  ORF type:complete len:236 (+),score=31.77 TRINITY_DN1522_c0_g1_i12:165-872(+)
MYYQNYLRLKASWLLAKSNAAYYNGYTHNYNNFKAICGGTVTVKCGNPYAWIRRQYNVASAQNLYKKYKSWKYKYVLDYHEAVLKFYAPGGNTSALRSAYTKILSDYRKYFRTWSAAHAVAMYKTWESFHVKALNLNYPLNVRKQYSGKEYTQKKAEYWYYINAASYYKYGVFKSEMDAKKIAWEETLKPSAAELAACTVRSILPVSSFQQQRPIQRQTVSRFVPMRSSWHPFHS